MERYWRRNLDWAGFAAYFFVGRKVLLGIVVAEALFSLGFYLGY